MKALVFALALVASTQAFASYNTDSVSATITCDMYPDKVAINKDRTVMTVFDSSNPEHPDKLKVTKRESDGDTQVTYTAAGLDSGKPYQVELTFSDQGDTFTYLGYGSETYDIDCRP